MTKLFTPTATDAELFHDATKAVDRLTELYMQATAFLRDHFAKAMEETPDRVRIRAYYPEIRFRTSTYARVDSRLAFGHVSSPGTFAATTAASTA